MRLRLVNRQRHEPVPLAWLTVLARCAAKRLRITEPGQLPVTFVDRRTMTQLNRRFLHHHRLTDVLTFRYPRETIVGDILIAPAAARHYARDHAVPYRRELARYLIHGLLHWLGYHDETRRQQRRMRQMEDRLLAQCVNG